MNRAELYKLAYAYRETRFWERTEEDQLFAVKLGNGMIGYVSIMGSGGRHCAIALYIGESQLASFFRIRRLNPDDADPLLEHEAFHSVECLQCVFDNRNMLDEDDLQEAIYYAREYGYSLYRPLSYPYFWACKTGVEPGGVIGRNIDFLGQAVKAATIMSAYCQPHRYILPHCESTQTIPCVTFTSDGYDIDEIPFSADVMADYLMPIVKDASRIETIKTYPTKSVLQVHLFLGLHPLKESDDDPMFFPWIMLIRDACQDLMLGAIVAESYDVYGTQCLLDEFMATLDNYRIQPVFIEAKTERTLALLEDFANKMGITVELQEHLPELSAIEEEIFADEGDVQGDFFDVDESYVISVSLMKGVYRHIQVPSRMTLAGLSDMILDSVHFDDDHAHAFFMDNRAWSRREAYFSFSEYGDEPTTDEVTLGELMLERDRKFLYIFDFGDEWRFSCRVLRVMEGQCEPKVIKRVGRAPKQYGSHW